MLRIIDARTGEPAPAAPARRAPTRVEAHVRGRDADALRVLLVADLLVRALELDGTPAWAVLTGTAEPDRLRKDAAALGIRPFEDGAAAGRGPGTGQGVRVVAEATAAGAAEPVAEGEDEGGAEGGAEGGYEGARDATTVAVAPVRPAALDLDSDLADPDAVRLALLERHHHARVELDAAVLDEARDTLASLRCAVADWALHPSRPVPGEVRDRLRAAWEDDLDAPGVLRLLRRVETDPDLADGARFEICAYADRFLGLHLTRDVGSPP
ncbi:hypothetical protein PEM37_26880 [Streptomyces sp. AD681]|uniref:hypothetical protein n=1 Tax=Streptomyces sp. AD681 TaxID=3019069 RepID=UPI0022F183EE|nr:hypothetical protein [Streptomyces sp. AD681]MDA5145137.1 hypothetical protein [Streptomyces sp. AD681]